MHDDDAYSSPWEADDVGAGSPMSKLKTKKGTKKRCNIERLEELGHSDLEDMVQSGDFVENMVQSGVFEVESEEGKWASRRGKAAAKGKASAKAKGKASAKASGQAAAAAKGKASAKAKGKASAKAKGKASAKASGQAAAKAKGKASVKPAAKASAVPKAAPQQAASAVPKAAPQQASRSAPSRKLPRSASLQEKRQFYMDYGCSKCRWLPGCTPSCWACRSMSKPEDVN